MATQFVEGLDNSVLGVFVTLGALTTAVLFVSLRYSVELLTGSGSQQTRIHPDNEAVVRATRELLARNGSTPQQDTTTNNGRSHLRTQHDITCPICLDTLRYGVETNCGHKACGSCWIAYYDSHSPVVQALRCPVCRRDVNILFTYFTSTESAATAEPRDRITSHVGLYNRRFSGDPVPFLDQLRELPTFLRHLFREFFTFRGLFIMVRVRLLFCLLFVFLYVLAPLDIIPEAVFGFFGLIDDALIILIILIYLNSLFRNVIHERSV